MASENETVEDIVNDLRFGIQSIKGCSQFVTDRLFGNLDRIESAWRREKAELVRNLDALEKAMERVCSRDTISEIVAVKKEIQEEGGES